MESSDDTRERSATDERSDDTEGRSDDTEGRSDGAAEYSGPDVPAPLGERLQTAFRLDERPRTFADWVGAMARVVERDGLTLDLDTLCTTDRSPHRAAFDGETRYFRCVLDAMIVPFLFDDVDTVAVRTAGPLSGDAVEIVVDGRAVGVGVKGRAVEVEPPGALTSFGVADDVSEPGPDEMGPSLAYGRVCPYVRAFPSPGEYETWAGTVDAVTVPVPVEDALELARALGSVGDG